LKPYRKKDIMTTAHNSNPSSKAKRPEMAGAPNPANTLPLVLSVHPDDGTLLTAPLLTVLNAATDTLYRDLHDMAYGSVTLAVPVATALVSSTTESGRTTPLPSVYSSAVEQEQQQLRYQTQTAPMSSLSFAQRRFQIASSISHHIRSIAHVAALVAAYLPRSGGYHPFEEEEERSQG